MEGQTDLEEVVVAEAMVAAEESEAQWPGGGARVRRRSMTMAGAQVFEMIGSNPEQMNPKYPETYSNWIQSSSLDLPTEGDLLADKPIPLRRWVRWGLWGATCIGVLTMGTLAGVLYRPTSHAWRWLAWGASTLAGWGASSALFFAVTLLIERTFFTSQHVIFYIQGARTPGARLLAAVSSLCVFIGLFAPFKGRLPTAVLRLLICAVIAAAGLLMAQVVTKVIAGHFHRQGFFEKLKTALLNEYYIMALSKPRGAPARRKSWTEQMYMSQTQSRPAKHVQKLGDTKLVLDDPKLLMSLEAVQRHVRTNRLKLVFDKCCDVRDEGAAKQLAFYILWNVMEDKSREYLLRSDLEHFLPEREIDGAFRLLDADGDGRPTWEECRDAVIRVFRQRQQLTASLEDSGSIMGTLHLILVILIQVACIFLYLLVWHVDIVRVWVTLSSVILAFTFVLGASIRRAYENVMFLFVVHPFDVGDRLLIDGQIHTVYKIKLSTTVFEQGDGTKVWYPNDKLAMVPILNQTRAECARESFEFAMDLDTPVTTFEAVQKAAEEYIGRHGRDFDGRCTCVTTATMDPLKLRLAISVTYSFNRAETQRLGEVRHGLILEVTKALVERKAAYTDSQVVMPMRTDPVRKPPGEEAEADEEEEDVPQQG